jgi:UPF0755 protein
MKIHNIFFIILSFIVISVVGAFVFYTEELKSVTPDSSKEVISYKINVPSGEKTRSVALELKQQNIIKNDSIMYLYARLNNFSLKAGSYHVKSSMSIPQIIDILQSGVQEYVRVSIPEGLTITKIGEILEKDKITSATAFYNAAYNEINVKNYGIPAKNFEGYLFPDTYFLTENMNADEVVKLMVDTFFKKVSEISDLEEKTSKEVFEIVILASIVEREYRVANEAPLIASVFTNRLKNNIGLYSCATVEYIVTEILKLPHPDIITTVGPNADTKINNPYNTYKWAGLPPGPISNPGIVALSAAIHPANTDYYYFRLVDVTKGTHVFTHDFDEHKEVGKNLYTKPLGGKK